MTGGASIARDHGLGGGYADRRARIETYFDRTALDAWRQLTSTEPVSGIRATVRAGRDRMRATLLAWLPDDLTGRRVLDAGCGSGALAVEAALRGADVTAVDVSAGLIELARRRAPEGPLPGAVSFHVGDMLDPAYGPVHHVVAMDSLIHYDTADVVRALASLAGRVSHAMAFTFAPRTPALALMHAVGRMFPRGDRAPAIVPVEEVALRRQIAAHPALMGWRVARTQRIKSGFYQSQAMELVRG
ncbi:MAG: magnesium protoporphyrin IX methyltransferase [Rhodospirillaceae bacterium]|nr:magnesium protoporphyrin IX methyltransferase [Rhodospirillaceae bacterium]